MAFNKTLNYASWRLFFYFRMLKFCFIIALVVSVTCQEEEEEKNLNLFKESDETSGFKEVQKLTFFTKYDGDSKVVNTRYMIIYVYTHESFTSKCYVRSSRQFMTKI